MASKKEFAEKEKEDYKSPPIGNKIFSRMYEINPKLVKDNTKLEEIFYSALKEDNFNILEKLRHDFEPYGVTLFTILAESEASLHTFPEYGTIVFSLYSCRGPKDGINAYNYFKEKVKPTRVHLEIEKVIVDPRHIGKYDTIDKIVKPMQ